MVKVLAINGSHRAGKNVASLLSTVLEEAQNLGAETELVELSELDIEFCLGCNRCLFKPECKITDDDMSVLTAKMLEADAIVLGSPNYFCDVSARMKNFMDRTRPLHMVSNQLKGKIAGYVTMSGLDNCGAESTADMLDKFCTIHEMTVIHPRPEGPVFSRVVSGSLMAGMKDGAPLWRKSVGEDPCAPAMAKQLGKDIMAALTK